MKRLLCGLCGLLLLLSAAGCGKEPVPERTLRTSVTAPAANWSSQGWSTQEEGRLASLLSVPLCQPVPKDTRTGEYQWAFLAAEEIRDVTGDHPEELARFGKSAAGAVYEIVLRQGLTWEDGTPIDADTYLYSMNALLSSVEDHPGRSGSAPEAPPWPGRKPERSALPRWTAGPFAMSAGHRAAGMTC